MHAINPETVTLNDGVKLWQQTSVQSNFLPGAYERIERSGGSPEPEHDFPAGDNTPTVAEVNTGRDSVAPLQVEEPQSLYGES